jgi:hypothetical protein
VLLIGALLSSVIVLSAAPFSAAGEAGGRSDEDLALERFLASAEIVRIEALNEGITKPERLVLEADGERHRAIFKDVDIEEQGISRNRRLEMDFSDRYVYEVAAYRLDRYLGLRLVPPTVVREVDGRRGSAQFWIEGAISGEEAIAQGHSFRDPERYRRGILFMRILDALILNVDRNRTNVLITIYDDGFHLIDHSRAFRRGKRLPRWNTEWGAMPVPEAVAERLRDLDLASLRLLLGDLIEDRQIRPILKRRDALLRRLREKGLLP